MARISTHVLDTASGRPASGVRIDLFRIAASDRQCFGSAVTNVDGRTDTPIFSGERIPVGVYELVFGAGEYLSKSGMALPDPPFLDEIVIRFGISDETGSITCPSCCLPMGTARTEARNGTLDSGGATCDRSMRRTRWLF